ncbi:MAG: ABC transporter permease, partial [Microvirga sp.]
MSLEGAATAERPEASPQAASTTRPAAARFAKLRVHLRNIYRLVIKELRGVRSDPIMLALVAYSFTVAVYAIATGARVEATNLSVGVVDEDRSDLSRRIRYGLAPPTFKPPIEISASEIDPAMNSQRFLFVIEIPPKFESDILAGRQASAQINIDATAVAQAFNGMSYIQNVIQSEVMDFVTQREGLPGPPLKFVTRAKFNPSFVTSWFTSVMAVINNLTMLAIILTGAALIRECEQGTVEHLLVMPVVPIEIMASKIIANGLVILGATALSLAFVVEGWLQVPVAGSRLLFLGGSSFYVFTVAALGILLA